MPKALFDATFTLVAETERAILVTEDGGKNKVWLPKSQIEYEVAGPGFIQVGKEINVTMPVWLAKEKAIAGA